MQDEVKEPINFKKIIRSILPEGKLARAVTVIAGGAALGQAITVLVSPILTRLYLPADFGVFGVYASILGIVTVIASLRYEYAILLPEDDVSAANILAVCFVILLGTTSLSCFVIYIWGVQFVAWANVPELVPYLWLIPFGMLGTGIYQILNYWAVRKRDFSRISRTLLTRGVARASIQVGLGLMASGPTGLLLGQWAGDSAGCSYLGRAAWIEDRASLKAVSLQGMRKAAARYIRFPIYSSVASFTDALGLNVPQFLFAAFYGAEVAGWFALGQRVIAVPLNILIDSVSQVYFGEAARLPKDDSRSLRRFFFKLTGKLVLTGVIPVATICALAPWFSAIVFGPSWENAGKYVQILGLMFAVRFAVIPLQHTLNVLERQDLLLLWDCIRLVIVVGALLAGNLWGFSHIAAVGAYSLSMSATYILLWGIVLYSITSRSNIIGKGI